MKRLRITSFHYRYIHQKLDSGITIDDILDEEDPFEIIEPLLQREEFPIFVLTIINKIQSDTVMNTLLASIEKGIKEKSDTRLSNQR